MAVRYKFPSVWRSTTYRPSPQQPHLRQLFGSMEGSLCANGLRARTTEPSCQHILQTFKPNKMIVEGPLYAACGICGFSLKPWFWNVAFFFRYLWRISTSISAPASARRAAKKASRSWIPQNMAPTVGTLMVSPSILGSWNDPSYGPWWPMFLPAVQKAPLHRYGSPMRVPLGSSAQKLWISSICRCRVHKIPDWKGCSQMFFFNMLVFRLSLTCKIIVNPDKKKSQQTRMCFKLLWSIASSGVAKSRHPHTVSNHSDAGIPTSGFLGAKRSVLIQDGFLQIGEGQSSMDRLGNWKYFWYLLIGTP